jgi:general secretion pathway protein M
VNPALSPVVSRGLALAILVALLLLAFTGIVQPLLETYGKARAAAEQMRTAIAHAEGVGRNPAVLKAELAQLKERQNSTVGFLRGTNEPLAAAELQDRLKTIVESAHGELRSTQILPARDEGRVRRISIRCQVQADIADLQRIFYQLESASPLLFLDNIEIRPRPSRLGGVDSSLEVRFDLYGYMRSAS